MVETREWERRLVGGGQNVSPVAFCATHTEAVEQVPLSTASVFFCADVTTADRRFSWRDYA